MPAATRAATGGARREARPRMHPLARRAVLRHRAASGCKRLLADRQAVIGKLNQCVTVGVGCGFDLKGRGAAAATPGRIPPARDGRIRIGMPRSAAQSDFVVQAAPPPEMEAPVGPIGEGTDAVELPRAVIRSPFASERATRLVMAFTFIVLGALLLLTMIGPHIPAGE